MKLNILAVSIIALLLASCSSSKYMYDDAYYNPKDEIRAERKATRQADNEANNIEEVPVTEGFAAAEYTEPNSEVLGVYDGDTLALETFDYENGDKDVIVNNYYEGSASYTDYGSRLSRFYGPSIGFGYYSPVYYGYSPYYYDPFYYPYYSPYYYGPRFSLSFGFGWGYGYGYNYYSPYYPVQYNYYNTGYYSGGGSGIYISDGSSRSNPFHATRRRGTATNRNIPTVKENDKRYVSSSTTGTRDGSINNTSSQVTAASSRRNADALRNSNQERTIPQRTGTPTATRRSGSATQNRAGTQTAVGTRVIPKSNTSATRTTAASSDRRYVPRYSNPRTTTKPTYNNSSSRNYNVKAPTTKSSPYSSPARRSTSRYSSPSRSSSGSGVMNLGRSSISRSSSSGSRSSGGISVSSGSSSRSSGSTSRSSTGRTGRRR